MDDLVRWLTGAWDEEEARARACLDVNIQAAMLRGAAPPRWVMEGSSIADEATEDRPNRVLRVKHTWPAEALHIILHDPASVLARIAADRKILAEHSSEFCQDAACATEPCRFKRLLASPYASRPGYQKSWAVQ